MGTGTGTKTQMNFVSEKPLRLAGSMSASFRNLCKSDLGGAIFGCNRDTMEESLGKQLFGLPFPHFSFVRNITPGMPLFLFNYSDRKLHGIYEAASHGQLCIDPYAWTEDGKERTAFPAQVRIRIRTQCQPLTKKQYSEIIKDNYYGEKQHLWFELDHAQTEGLMALFEYSTLPSRTLMDLVPSRKGPMGNMFPKSPLNKWKSTANSKHADSGSGEQKWDSKPSDGSNDYASLDLNNEDVEHGNSSKRSTIDAEEGENVHGGHSNFRTQSTIAPEEREFKELVSELESDREENVQVSQLTVSPYPIEEISWRQTLLEQQSGVDGFKNVFQKLQELSAGRKHSFSSSKDSMNDSDMPGDVNEESRLSKESVVFEENTTPPNLSRDVHEESRLLKESSYLVQNQENTTTPELYHGDTELVRIIKELKEATVELKKKQVESDLEMQQLRNVVKGSGKVFEEMKGQIKELESKLFLLNQYLGLEKVMYLIGGFDGTSWISSSSLDSFSPAIGILKSLRPMSFAHSYASAVALNDNFYVFGGGDGKSWTDTVECYSPRDNDWTLCPHLIRPKGSLAGAALNGKIFAIGGGYGDECFQDVEMFDPALGRWVNIQPLLQKRFATAAAELHGVIYAVGGYDGMDYLQSVERYDPRDACWSRAPSMKTRRGSHSLAVLNEKIFAVGGYDGEKMVQSVEVFDPRLGTWMMAEHMSFARGYSAAAVLDDSLFVIGGINGGENVMDSVECYKEGAGWTVVRSEAIGRRSFLSATVV